MTPKEKGSPAGVNSPTSSAGPWRVEADAVVLTVRLTPRSSRDAIEGIGRLSDGTAVLQARVRAVPEDGRANAALADLLAKAFGVPKSAVTLVAGGRSRLKQVRIAGDPAGLLGVARQWQDVD